MYYQILIKDAFQEPLPWPAFFHRPTQVHEDLSSGGRVEGKGWAGCRRSGHADQLGSSCPSSLPAPPFVGESDEWPLVSGTQPLLLTGQKGMRLEVG